MSDPAPRIATLRDIARQLGVHHSTVSLALRDSPEISPARRLQIQETARAMGYHTNPFAAILGHQRHHTPAPATGAVIAWINCWEQPERLRGHREFALYWEGARQAAEKSGHSLEEFRCNAHMPARRLQAVLAARNVRGLVLPPLGRNPDNLAAFDWTDFTVVRFGYSFKNLPFDTVTSNQLSNSLLACENMRRLGCTRIGYATSMVMHTRFKAGFLMAQSDLPASLPVPLLTLPTGENKPDDLRQLGEWLQAHRPDAILTDLAGMPAMLAETGRRVPHDIGLATLSVLDGNADTGIYQNSEEIGKTAVETLLSLLKLNHRGIPAISRETLIEGHWVDGTSLPPKTTPVHQAMIPSLQPSALPR